MNPTVSPSASQLALKPAADLLKLNPNQKISATIKTSLGDIKVELFADKAPNTVANFVGLSEGTQPWLDPRTNQLVDGKPLYQNVIFHRIIKDFMVQGGDPLGQGFGGPGYKFADETTGEAYLRGTLAMANSGRNTNGSQFFIVHKDYPLPPLYTVFGRINASDSASFAVLDKIAAVKTGPNDRPIDPPVILSISIARQ